ncbi:MAG: TMEM175 family protein [Patescibacteria group bacterium]
MKTSRLEQLSDGIFAIVMTILVFDLKVTGLPLVATNADIWHSFMIMKPIFLSYLLSFIMLFNYWRAHHFFISIYAKNIDMTLTNINALFFLFIGLVPFSTALLGSQDKLELPIILFSLNVIIIGFCLYIMRGYVFKSAHIQNTEVGHEEVLRGTMRTLVPVFFAVIAIPLSFLNKELALGLLTLSIFFNLFHASTHILMKMHKIKF